MKTSLFSSGTRRFAAVACLALGLTVAAPAFAVLGGAPMTPPAGAVVNNAVARAAVTGASSASASAYTVRSTTLAIGTVVNEYVGASGVVFGIAWRGPRFPIFPVCWATISRNMSRASRTSAPTAAAVVLSA